MGIDELPQGNTDAAAESAAEPRPDVHSQVMGMVDEIIEQPDLSPEERSELDRLKTAMQAGEGTLQPILPELVLPEADEEQPPS